MKITIVTLSGGELPIFNKDINKDAIVLDEDGQILQVSGSLTNPGTDKECKTAHFVVLIQKISPQILRDVANVMEYATRKGYETGNVVVSDSKEGIGFFAV